MKHSVFIKFLAILLCAVSLTGIVGGAAGTLVLAKEDLYNRTVDQMLAEKVRDDARFFADQAALSYASRSLGSCPDEMVQRYNRPSGYDFGYTILDAEGNVLESRNPERKENAEVYSFPVTGQYMHLVSLETETEQLARETAERMNAIGRLQEDQNGQILPLEGVPVNQVIFTDYQGAPIYEAYSDSTSCYSIFYYSENGNVRGSSRHDQQPQQQIGFLYYGTDGQLMYRSFLEEQDHNFTSAEICGVLFLSHESGFLFQNEAAEGLGTLQFENGHLLFSGHIPEEEVPAETIGETIPETTAQTVAETAPAETVVETQPVEEPQAAEEPPAETQAPAEEAPAEETYPAEEEPSSASAVPEEEYEEEYVEEYSEEESVEEAVETEALPAPETQPPETLPPETLPPETIPQETMPEEARAEETLPQNTEPVRINGKPLEFYQVNRTEYHNSTTGELTTAKYVYLSLPEITVEVYADRNSLGNEAIYDGLRLLRQYRQFLLPAIGICLLIFAVCVVYLCTAAGRNPKSDEVRAGALNRLPLDLYLVLALLAGTGMIALAVMGIFHLLERDFLLGCTVAAASGFSCCLLAVGFLFACLAQCKAPDGYWWRNLLSIRFVFLSMRLMKKLEAWLREIAFPWLGWLLKKTWAKLWKALVWLYETTEKLTAKSGRILNRYFSLMPLTWQWVLCGMLLFFLLLIVQTTASNFLTLICLTASLAMILYGAHCFGILLATARKMGKGDLETKITSKIMVGSFKDFADDLNDLADVAMVAAQNQLKSERMKTELITNVSHDIKTPLTSIINYVDLLQKPHTEEEGTQYLEVLDRQSQRLKKLVEDLMDMSKASTGNMTVEIARVDAVESVNQALGEFADKLERARLYPVFRHTEASAFIMADGKLVWRVLSNLLSNTVKYAMPGTRVYLDLNRVDGNVVISLKNISRDELNVDAEELMERFVRGDISRNTDGSGLGLNIAKSLMELQNGHLQLLVDGDLFKVTLVFPDAK